MPFWMSCSLGVCLQTVVACSYVLLNEKRSFGRKGNVARRCKYLQFDQI